MPNINKNKIWVTTNIRYGLWLKLKERAIKNDTSVQKELEKILAKELKELVQKKQLFPKMGEDKK